MGVFPIKSHVFYKLKTYNNCRFDKPIVVGIKLVSLLENRNDRSGSSFVEIKQINWRKTHRSKNLLWSAIYLIPYYYNIFVITEKN